VGGGGGGGGGAVIKRIDKKINSDSSEKASQV